MAGLQDGAGSLPSPAPTSVSTVAGVQDDHAPSGLGPDEAAAHVLCPMQRLGSCPTQSSSTQGPSPEKPVPRTVSAKENPALKEPGGIALPKGTGTRRGQNRKPASTGANAPLGSRSSTGSFERANRESSRAELPAGNASMPAPNHDDRTGLRRTERHHSVEATVALNGRAL